MEVVNSLINLVPQPIKIILLALPVLGRVYMALKQEGGIKGIWRTVVLGQPVKKEDK